MKHSIYLCLSFLLSIMSLNSILGNIEIGQTFDPSNGQNNGRIQVIANGTSAPFTLALNLEEINGDLTLIEEVDNINGTHWFIDLGTGTYIINISNEYGCTYELKTMISDCGEIIIDPPSISQPTGCNANNGGFHFFTGPQGGTAPYSYLWNSGQTSASVNGLTSGLYELTISDATGCTAVKSYELTNYGQPELFFSVQETCEGVNNGGIDLYPVSINENGTYNNDFTIQWSNGESSIDLENLYAGTYCVTVTDNTSSCSASECTDVPGTPSGGPISVTNSITSSCSSGGSGSITLNINGGTPPYNYNWSGSAEPIFGSLVESLESGTYCVTITDLCNSTYTDCYNVGAYDITLSAQTENACTECDCYNECSCDIGSIDLTVNFEQGTSSSFFYEWSNASTDQDLEDLSGGTYCVTVSNWQGCNITECFTVGEEEATEVTAGFYGYYFLLDFDYVFQPIYCVTEIRCHGDVVGYDLQQVDIDASAGVNNEGCIINAYCGDSESPFSSSVDNSGTLVSGEIRATDDGCYQGHVCYYIDYNSFSTPFLLVASISETLYSPVNIQYECVSGSNACNKIYSCNGEIVNTVLLNTSSGPEFYANCCSSQTQMCCFTFSGEGVEKQIPELSKGYNSKTSFQYQKALIIDGKRVVKYDENISLGPEDVQEIPEHLQTVLKNQEKVFLPQTTENKVFEIKNIFPNPFSDNVNIVLYSPINQEIQITVYDLLGQEVYNDKLYLDMDETTIKIQSNTLRNDGLYFIQVTDKAGNTVVKKITRNS